MVYEMKEVIDDLKHGSYARIMSNKDQDTKISTKKVTREQLQPLVQGEITYDENQIKLINVPLNAPNGDVLGDPVSCIVILKSTFLMSPRSRKDTVFCSSVQTAVENQHSTELLGNYGHSQEENSSHLISRT